jgi:hypothetical protein
MLLPCRCVFCPGCVSKFPQGLGFAQFNSKRFGRLATPYVTALGAALPEPDSRDLPQCAACCGPTEAAIKLSDLFVAQCPVPQTADALSLPLTLPELMETSSRTSDAPINLGDVDFDDEPLKSNSSALIDLFPDVQEEISQTIIPFSYYRRSKPRRRPATIIPPAAPPPDDGNEMSVRLLQLDKLTHEVQLAADTDESDLCPLCFDDQVCVASMPCGHVASCAECAAEVMNQPCVMCRGPVSYMVVLDRQTITAARALRSELLPLKQ